MTRRIDFRKRPELYRIGRGEQGVLQVEPYKSEILPHWRFKTVAEARVSAAAIFRLFRAYGSRRDFVGMDMARKFLQMGFTRARRYANRRSGRKYAPGTRRLLPREPDEGKARASTRRTPRHATAGTRPWRPSTASATKACAQKERAPVGALRLRPEALRQSRSPPRASSRCSRLAKMLNRLM